MPSKKKKRSGGIKKKRGKTAVRNNTAAGDGQRRVPQNSDSINRNDGEEGNDLMAEVFTDGVLAEDSGTQNNNDVDNEKVDQIMAEFVPNSERAFQDLLKLSDEDWKDGDADELKNNLLIDENRGFRR